MPDMDPEEARHFRKILYCGKCKRQRGHELLPNRDAGGRVENHRFKCAICGNPSQNTITMTMQEVQLLKVEGERVRTAHREAQLEAARQYALDRLASDIAAGHTDDGDLEPGEVEDEAQKSL